MYNITFYFQPYTYEVEDGGDIALKEEYLKAGMTYPEAYKKVKEEFAELVLERLKRVKANTKGIVFTDELLRVYFDFNYDDDKEFKDFAQSWISFFVRDLMGVFWTMERDEYSMLTVAYKWDNFDNIFFGGEYFEDSIPLINIAEIRAGEDRQIEFGNKMCRLIFDRKYLEGEQKLVRCSFDKIEKDLIKRNIPDKEIQEYKDACSEPLDKVILRCPNCGCDRWETKRTDRVYMGDVDGEVDIIEDPHEDGELDEEMFCSKCFIALDRFNY